MPRSPRALVCIAAFIAAFARVADVQAGDHDDLAVVRSHPDQPASMEGLKAADTLGLEPALLAEPGLVLRVLGWRVAVGEWDRAARLCEAAGDSLPYRGSRKLGDEAKAVLAYCAPIVARGPDPGRAMGFAMRRMVAEGKVAHDTLLSDEPALAYAAIDGLRRAGRVDEADALFLSLLERDGPRMSLHRERGRDVGFEEAVRLDEQGGRRALGWYRGRYGAALAGRTAVNALAVVGAGIGIVGGAVMTGVGFELGGSGDVRVLSPLFVVSGVSAMAGGAVLGILGAGRLHDTRRAGAKLRLLPAVAPTAGGATVGLAGAF